MVKDLRSLVQIPSVAEDGEGVYPYGYEVDRALKECLSLADKLGLHTREVDGRMGVIDLNECPPYLGLLCHLDVVPAGKGWTYPPFAGVVESGRMYGRGTSDNKGAVISVLYALWAIREAGITLKKGVRFLAGTDEERGSSDLKYYRSLETLPPVMVSPDGMYPLINVEKGHLKVRFEVPVADEEKRLISISGAEAVNVVPSEATAVIRGIKAANVRCAISRCPEGLEYQVKETKEGNISITIKGKGAHAATPQEGRNSLTALYLLLSNLPLGAVSQAMSTLSQLFPYGEIYGESSGVACEDAASGKLTLVNSRAGYENGTLWGQLDIRFPVTMKRRQIEDMLKTNCGSRKIYISEMEGNEGHYTKPDLPYVQAMLRAYAENTGNTSYPISMGGGTYVHDIDGGVAFGILRPDQEPVHTHGSDEYLNVENLVLNAKILAQSILDICR
ncbi:MAG: Sapep family Mn(2+)-dependent dipeptidase [Oliverpabstia sp.]